MAQNKPILYTYFRSSCSWRVRIALSLKGVAYESVPVNLVEGEHLSERFRAINPTCEVPAFVDKGNIISHSVAILEYIEETHPDPPLFPKDPFLRAQVRGFIDGIVAGIQPLQNMKVLRYIGKDYNSWAQHWIESGFASLERILQKTHGKYCFGDDVTLADVCLVPQVYNANRYGADVSQFPLITEICSRLSELEAFKVTHPALQADCPEDFKA